ncbi:Nucleoside-diphosphate-sugar epimerase [Dyella sp. OK004]|uniref:NAD-dependent epimerase/dehydratase family protein n=1 Tax=Dyella sp. OK004 TaxID=1855292 RepID=UPI0008E26348|nr:NAD-dependent epimerase/dehydratase family protein [Dyella sp. OK004]SFS19289.1 Nucleoside-diphosphate-sugar epimerase [Dyella sp. OK004]
MKTSKTALVVGANGGVGSETCLALRRHGWQVRAMARAPKTDALDGVEWVRGDAMVAADVLRAAQGVQVIVHAVNPPGYRGWGKVVLPMLDNSIAAARAVGARIVLPGTVYNYGPDAFPLLREDSPQHPQTRKGELRVAMEQRLEQAAQEGTPVLILRCGDFFGPRSTANSWFSQGLTKPGMPVRKVSYPGALDIGHAWAYLPDVAETLATLLDRGDELADFARYHFGGYWLDGRGMVEAVRRAADNPDIVAGRFPWWLVTLASPFVETLREMRKMRYLWRTPVQLDDTRLRAFLGKSPYTPIEQAIRCTLEGAGSLPATREFASAA